MFIFRKSYQKTLGLVLCFCLLCTTSFITEAAGFTHQHTASCYSTTDTECTANHTTKNKTEQGTHHCNTCQAMQSCTTHVTWDVCPSTGLEREVSGYQICNQCGSKVNEWGGSVGKHMISAGQLICGKTTSTYGKLTLTAANNQWTKTPFLITGTFKDSSNTIVLHKNPYSWDNGASWTNQNTLQVDKNGIYCITLREIGGNRIQESIQISCFDFQPPTIQEIKKSTSEWTNKPVEVQLLAADLQPDQNAGSGLHENAYCMGEGAWQSQSTFQIKENGVYIFKVRDVLDNVAQTEYRIDNIDTTPPVITQAKVKEEGWQKGSVTITIEANDGKGSGLHEKAFGMNDAWQALGEFTVSENGEYEIKARDALGQMSSTKVAVANLDNEIPSIDSLEADKTQLLKEKVYITIKASDKGGSGLHKSAYSVDGGKSWNTGNGFWIEEGKEYEIVVRDAVGNYSKSKKVTRNGFEYPPEEKPSETPKDNTPGDNTPKDNTPKDDTPKDNTPKDDTPKDNTPKDNTPKDNTPKDSTPNDSEQDKTPSGESDVVTDKSDKADMQEPETDESLFEEEKQMRIEGNAQKTLSQKQNAEQEILEKPKKDLSVPQKTAIAVGSILGILALLSGCLWIFGNTAVLLCYDGEGKYERLGRCLIRRKENANICTISEALIESASSCQYRVLLPKWFAIRHRQEDFYVCSKNKKVKLRLEESMDFTL